MQHLVERSGGFDAAADGVKGVSHILAPFRAALVDPHERGDGLEGVLDAVVDLVALDFLLPQREAQIQFAHHLAGKRVKGSLLEIIQRIGLVVQHAERSDWHAVLRLEQRAGIEAQAICGHAEFIVGRAGILVGVVDLDKIGAEHDVRADRGDQRGFARADADFGLEPLAVFIDQIDHRDRHIADLRGQFHDLIEIRLARRIEDFILAKGFQPERLLRVRGGFHAADIPVRVAGLAPTIAETSKKTALSAPRRTGRIGGHAPTEATPVKALGGQDGNVGRKRPGQVSGKGNMAPYVSITGP